MAYKRKYRQGARVKSIEDFLHSPETQYFSGTEKRFINKSLCTGSLICLSGKSVADIFILQTRTFQLMEMRNELLWVCLQQLSL